MQLSLRRFVVRLAVPAVLIAAATCTGSEPGVAPAPSAGTHRASLSFKTAFSASASQASSIYQAANLTIDRVRVVIVRPPQDTLKDTTITTTPGAPDFVLDLQVSAIPGEQLQGGLEFLSGSLVLFSGQGTVTAHAVDDPSTPTASVISVIPVGPGANAAKVVVTPATGSFPTAASTVFAAAATTSAGVSIPNAIFAWSIDDATVATIDASNGVVTPTTKGGVVHVRATTLNGTFGEAVVTFFAPPARLVIVSGDRQTGEVATALPQPLVVQVQSANGQPVPNQTVVFGGSNGGTASPASVVTDASGTAQTTLTTGSTVGAYTFAASTGTFSASATETATAGAAAAIVAVSGGGQTDTVQHTLKSPFVVKVTDRLGNPKNGATVSWTRTTGTGTPASATTSTGADGQSSFSYTLGTAPGTETVNASVTGSTTAAAFSVTTVAGRPAVVVAVSGGGQTGVVGSTVGSALVIQVSDTIGNPVVGAAVAWVVTSGTATLVNPQATTGLDGRASTTVTLGATPGPVVITATTGGRSVAFNLTVTAVPATTLTLVSGGGQTAVVGSVLSNIAVRVTDAQSNPVPNDNVTFAVATGGGSVVSTGTTDAQGLAHATWTLGAAVGTQTLTATRAGLSGSPLTISATATASGATAVAVAFVSQPSSTAAGGVISPAVTVRAVDLQGNLVSTFTGNISVGIAANPGDASLGGTVTRAAVGGVATFNDLTIGTVAVGYALSASAVGLTSATSSPFNITTVTNTRTWNGSASTDWQNSANWTGGLPLSTNDVVIPPSTPNSPALTQDVSVNNLTVNSGATLSVGAHQLTASGNVDATGGITGTGSVALTGTGKTVSGALPTLNVTGATTTISTVGATTVSNLLNVTNGATFTVVVGGTVSAGATSVPNGTLVVSGGSTTLASLLVSGTFSQTGGTIDVAGAATFSGSTAAPINGGQLLVGGNFTQGGSASAFVASGTHRTTFNGTAAQTIQMVSPATSHFQDLEFSGSGVVTLLNAGISAVGQLLSPAGTSTIHGNGFTLSVAGLNVDGLVLDNALLNSVDGTITQFDNVTFQNYLSTVTPLTITQAGSTAAYVFNNTQFLVTPTTGKFLSVTDDNTADGRVLTINLLGATPANGTSATATAGGAIVNWGNPGAANLWTNASGGSWNVPTNWSLGRVPVTGDSVVIALNGTYTVTLDVPFTTTYVTVGGGTGTQTLAVLTQPLTINSVLTLKSSAALSLANIIAGAGVMTNAGAVTFHGGTIALPVANQGSLISAANGTLAATLTAATGSTILIQSDGSVSNDVLVVANGFTNNGAIQLSSTTAAYAADLSVSNGTLTNAAGGTITTLVGTGGGRTLDAQLNNQGLVTVNQPLTLTHTNVAQTNSGTINALADFTILQSGPSAVFTNLGNLTIAPSHLLTVGGGAYTTGISSALNGGGAMTLTGVSPATLSTFTLSALTLTGSVVTLAQNISTASVALSIDASTILGPGTITNAASQSVTIKNSTIDATSALLNQGTLVVSAATNINGPLTTAAGSTLRVQTDGSVSNDALTVANPFTNNGTIELSSTTAGYSSQLIVGPTGQGALTNAPGATISVLAGTGGSRMLNAALINQGTLNVDEAFTLAPIGANASNAGTINVAGAAFTINQSNAGDSFTNTGLIHVLSGSSWTINAGILNEQSTGTIDGGGTLTLNNVATNFGTPFTLSALTVVGGSATLQTNLTTAGLVLSVNGATINGPGTITNATGQTLTLLNTTIASTAPLSNQGTIIVNANTSINSGLTTSVGSTILVQTDGSVSNDVLTVANGFTNNGTIQLSATTAAYASQLTVTTGTLTNAASGTITALAGTGGSRTIDAALANLGTLTVNQPLTITHADAASTNNGSINVSGGDLTITMNGTVGTFTVQGTGGNITAATGRTVTVNGGTFTIGPSSALLGSGTLTLNHTTANFNTAPVIVALNANNSGVTLPGNYSNTNTVITLNGSTLSGSGTFTNVAAQTLTLTGASTIGTTGFTNNGTLVVNASSAITSSTVTTGSTSTILIETDGTVSNDVLTVSNGFTNNGAIQLSSTTAAYTSQLTVTSGTLTNVAGATITALVGTGGPRQINANLTNAGTVSVNEPLTLTGTTYSNTGTIDATNADLTITETGSSPNIANNGTLTVGPTHTLTVNNGTFDEFNAGGIINGGGTLTLNSVATTVATGWTLSALNVNNGSMAFTIGSPNTTGLNMSVNGATLSGTGVNTFVNASGQTMTLKNATLASTLAMQNAGSLVVNANSTLSGGLSTVSGSSILIQSDGSVSSVVLSVAFSLSNSGTIQLSSTTSAYSSQLTVGNTLTNTASGTISTLAGTGGARTIAATSFVNQGTLNVVPAGVGTLAMIGAFTNASNGTVNLELASTASYDAINISGSATLGGTLNVLTLGAFAPATNDAFTLLTYGSGSGDFATYNLPTGSWTHVPGATSLQITKQ